MIIRLFKKNKDYAIISEWWNSHGSFAPKEDQLPETGLIVEIEDIPVCAGFFYKTDSSISVFEFVVCNPSASKEMRDIGLKELIEGAKYWARSHGFDLIYTSSGIDKYIQRLGDAGFITTNTDQSHMFYQVGSIQ